MKQMTIPKKFIEYSKPLILVFIDYEKTLDSFKNKEMVNALAGFQVDSRYLATLQQIYKNATANVRLLTNSKLIAVYDRYIQSSPNLLTTLLEYMVKNVELEDVTIHTDLNHP